MDQDVEQMYNLTRSTQNFFLNINSMFSNKSTDKSDDVYITEKFIKLYCHIYYEISRVWGKLSLTYNSYKIDGRFSNPYDN